jgi:hypothetical protein
MNMSFKHYWAQQEQRWYDQYLQAEKTINEMEVALRKIEDLAFKHIENATVRDEVSKIVDAVWRGARG